MADPRPPAALASLYGALAPDPDAEYGTLMPWAVNRPGSASWVQNGADPRFAMPSIMRDGLKGWLDLAAGTETGRVTPEAIQSLVFGGLAGGGMLAPRGALASGGGPIRVYLHGDQTYPLYGTGRTFTTESRALQQTAEDAMRARTIPQQPSALGDYAPSLRRGRANDERVTLMEQGGPTGGAGAPKFGYEADLHVDPRTMIDWHAPMNWQPPAALDMAEGLGLGRNFDSGRSLYREVRNALGERNFLLGDESLVGHLAAPKIMDTLDRGFVKRGIPGIKYGEPGELLRPRTGYVMFPGTEDKIDIIRRYMLGAPAPFAIGDPSGLANMRQRVIGDRTTY